MRRNSPGISKGVDYSIVGLYLLLVSIGILAVYAVTYKEGDPIISTFFSFKTDYSKQFYFFLLSGVIAIFILLTDSKFFPATANVWYAIGIVLLLLVFPFHSNVKGTESIIRFGGFQFQPAEFCKVCVCLALAKYLSTVNLDFSKTRSQLIAAAIAISPALITIAQKETGLALVYFSFFLVMYREGLPATILIIAFSVVGLVVASIVMDPLILGILLAVIFIVAAFIMSGRTRRRSSGIAKIIFILILCELMPLVVVPFVFKNIMQPHQTERIYDLFGKENPYSKDAQAGIAPTTASGDKEDNYNVKQSKIAIGSGRILGKGLLKSTQTRYDFVPEQRTDFIFCTIGEGFGFMGTSILLLIYIVLLFRIVAVAERQRSVFSRCYAYGVASVIFFHITINVCMTIGLAPVIGIPLPFISYGGTALLTFTILLFIMIRLDADRQMVLR
jgi:rod shape determining protein RodA